MKHWQSASDSARCRGKPYNGGRKRISFYRVCAFYVQMLICDPFHKRGMCRARGWGKRVETVGVYPLNSRFPLFLSLTQTRDRRPLREGERQKIFSTAGAHSVRPFLYLYAMPDTVLLHISAALRRCSTAVPHTSFACCYRRHLRIKSVVIVIL